MMVYVVAYQVSCDSWTGQPETVADTSVAQCRQPVKAEIA